MRKAFDYKNWGIDLMNLPAGEIAVVNTALSAYNALNGYTRSTGKTVEWAKRNPQAWDFVANVIADRKERLARERQADGSK